MQIRRENVETEEKSPEKTYSSGRTKAEMKFEERRRKRVRSLQGGKQGHRSHNVLSNVRTENHGSHLPL